MHLSIGFSVSVVAARAECRGTANVRRQRRAGDGSPRVCVSVARAFQPEPCAVDFDRAECSVSRGVRPPHPRPLSPVSRGRGEEVVLLCVLESAIAPLARGRGEGMGVRGQLTPAVNIARVLCRQFVSREDAKPRREMQGAEGQCSVFGQASRGRESAGVRFCSSGFPARVLCC